MVKRIENNCCDCAAPAFPCRGVNCPNRRAEHYYCDKCQSEDKLYEYNGEELCEECLLETVPVLEGSNI